MLRRQAPTRTILGKGAQMDLCSPWVGASFTTTPPPSPGPSGETTDMLGDAESPPPPRVPPYLGDSAQAPSWRETATWLQATAHSGGGKLDAIPHTPTCQRSTKCFLCPGRLVGAEEEPSLVSGISDGAERYRSISAVGSTGVQCHLGPPPQAALPWELGLQTKPHRDWTGISLSDDTLPPVPGRGELDIEVKGL